MRRHLRRFAHCLSLATFLFCGAAESHDEFDAVRCDKDVSTALLGRKSGDGPVVQIEAGHRDLKLENLGGEEISDVLNSSSWSICGREYQLLYDSRRIVRDALPFPAHARTFPEFSGTCRRKGRELPGTVVAVLDNPSTDIHATSHYSPADKIVLRARAAWRVDEASGKFVPLSTNGLLCARAGIITADGGP